MYRYTATADLAVLTPISIRGMVPETINAYGNMSSTSLVRSKLNSEDTLLSLARKTAKAIDFAMDNAFVPLEKVLASIENQSHNTGSYSRGTIYHNTKVPSIFGIVLRKCL